MSQIQFNPFAILLPFNLRQREEIITEGIKVLVEKLIADKESYGRTIESRFCYNARMFSYHRISGLIARYDRVLTLKRKPGRKPKSSLKTDGNN